MADDALDARRWLGIPPNRQHALQADQIGPLDAIRYRHLRCLDVGERSKDALGLRQQFDLGGRVLLDAPQVLDDERQSGRIRPREDFDFLGRAGAGGNPQYIAVTGPDQIGLGTAHHVLEDPLAAGRLQRVPLQVQVLVVGRYAGVADQHGDLSN